MGRFHGRFDEGMVLNQVSFDMHDAIVPENIGVHFFSSQFHGSSQIGTKSTFRIRTDQAGSMSGARFAEKEVGIDPVLFEVFEVKIAQFIVRYFADVTALTSQPGDSVYGIGCGTTCLNVSGTAFCLFLYFF